MDHSSALNIFWNLYTGFYGATCSDLCSYQQQIKVTFQIPVFVEKTKSVTSMIVEEIYVVK